MKTLDQLDAKLVKRTPLSSLPITINAPGSYYLTGNLTVGTGTAIIVIVDQVTIDLNGFTISSTASPASGTAVLLNPGTATFCRGQRVGGVAIDAGIAIAAPRSRER